MATSSAAGDPIQVASKVPYLDETTLPTKIVSECTALGTKLAASLHEFSTKYGVETVLVDELDPRSEGRVFQVQITNALSRGNAFIGHHKSVSARGELFIDGESRGIANFTRDSSGGFGAGFKGSCSVLGRCSRTLGNDFAKWLRDQEATSP